MPHLSSAKKRLRSDERKRLRNRYQHKSCRTYIKKITKMTEKIAAQKMLNEAISKIDKLAKNNIIHKNKAANQKSKLMRFVNRLP